MIRRPADPLRVSDPPQALPATAPRPVRAGLPHTALLAMQRSHGNRRVARWVGSPADRAEREAERVAHNAVGHSAVGHASAGRRDAGRSPVPASVARGIAAAQGRGQPLRDDVRTRMEGALGADLGAVRLHTDAAADDLNRALTARAFTTGRDIFFRAGQHRPESPAGAALLAHELAHTVQQRSAPADAPIRRALAPAHLNAPHDVVDEWLTASGSFDPLDGVTTDRKKRAGTVEAVVPGGPRPSGGSVPRKETLLGWYWVHQFDGTKAGNGGWVRFHLLNENLDGRGTSKLNLVPTRQATNKNPRWTTRFDEVAKAEHNQGEDLHFIATVHFHPQVAGQPPTAGAQHQHFFPSHIEAEYRIWRNDDWELLADADLTSIAKPPATRSTIPVQLADASKDSILESCPLLDTDFVGVLVSLRNSFAMMGPGTTLQQVYDVISGTAEIHLMYTKTFRGQNYMIQPTLDGKQGWWPTLQEALRSPSPTKPLMINDNVDLAFTKRATTQKQRNAAAAVDLAARKAKVEQQRKIERAAEAAARRKPVDIDSIFASM